MSQVIDAAAKLSEAEDAVTAPLADSHIVTFADGVTIGTVLYTEAELRELHRRDLIDAQEASEKVVRLAGRRHARFLPRPHGDRAVAPTGEKTSRRGQHPQRPAFR